MSDRKKDSKRAWQILHVTVICTSGLVTSTFSISVCIVPLFSAIIGFIGLLALEVCNKLTLKGEKQRKINQLMV